MPDRACAEKMSQLDAKEARVLAEDRAARERRASGAALLGRGRLDLSAAAEKLQANRRARQEGRADEVQVSCPSFPIHPPLTSPTYSEGQARRLEDQAAREVRVRRAVGSVRKATFTVTVQAANKYAEDMTTVCG